MSEISPYARQIIAEKWKEKEAPRPELMDWRRLWVEDCERHELPAGTQVEKLELGGVYCERVTVGEVRADAVCFFVHGGGYVAGNCVTHRKMAAHMSMHSGLAVVLPDYRLAPEHPFPAGLDDTKAAYGALLDTGVSPQKTVLMGDSAGGGMILALMLSLRDAAQDMPAAALLLSPWTDIEGRLPSYDRNVAVDPSMAVVGLRDVGKLYYGEASPKNPYISPIHADLTGLPPLYVQVGGLEVMLDDSVMLGENAKNNGVDCTVEVWDGLWHVWQSMVPEMPEAVAAWEKFAAFAKKQIDDVA